MSHRSYAGTFQNPVEGMQVRENHETGKFVIWITDADRQHNSAPEFEEEGDAYEWLESLAQDFEDDYDQYLEENRDDIRRQEEYEQFKNEY